MISTSPISRRSQENKQNTKSFDAYRLIAQQGIEQVFDRRSAVEECRDSMVEHGLVNSDASCGQTSCDGVPRRSPGYAALNTMRYRRAQSREPRGQAPGAGRPFPPASLLCRIATQAIWMHTTLQNPTGSALCWSPALRLLRCSLKAGLQLPTGSTPIPSERCRVPWVATPWNSLETK